MPRSDRVARPPVGYISRTIGHSTRAFDELCDLLRRHEVGCVIDVRAQPGSRRMPHFDRERLAPALDEAGIEYVHLPELGGRRRSGGEAPNGGWRNESFRAYADHMAVVESDRLTYPPPQEGLDI